LTTFQVGKGFDDTLWWNDRLILEQQALELARIHDVAFESEIRIHDEGMLI